MTKKEKAKIQEEMKKTAHSLYCALTHDIHVCDECKKCKGNNGPEIRVNLLQDLIKLLGDLS